MWERRWPLFGAERGKKKISLGAAVRTVTLFCEGQIIRWCRGTTKLAVTLLFFPFQVVCERPTSFHWEYMQVLYLDQSTGVRTPSLNPPCNFLPQSSPPSPPPPPSNLHLVPCMAPSTGKHLYTSLSWSHSVKQMGCSEHLHVPWVIFLYCSTKVTTDSTWRVYFREVKSVAGFFGDTWGVAVDVWRTAIAIHKGQHSFLISESGSEVVTVLVLCAFCMAPWHPQSVCKQ